MATQRNLEFNVEVERPSSIVRKLAIKVSSREVKKQLEKSLIAIQKTAQVKGFRPGHVPISIVKQHYGEDAKHRVFHHLIDESLEEAIKEQKFHVVGRPQIDTSKHQTGQGAHDHSIQEEQDLSYTATIEVMPEFHVKDYLGVAVSQEKVELTDEQVEKVIENLQNSQAQLVPASGGLVLADGKESSRPVQNGDFVDLQMTGGIVTDSGIEPRDELSGNRVIEISSDTWIPGFEAKILGMRCGESQTFRLTIPKDFSQASLSEKEAEFAVVVNEIKEKKLPSLDDEFAKQAGYENLGELRAKARDFLFQERTAASEREVQSELLGKIIEKNPFEVPLSLIEGQVRVLAQEWAEELKRQGYDEKIIQNVISQELENLKKRAESQVKASLILEAIAKKENISVKTEELETEIENLSKTMKVDQNKLEEYYEKNPNRKDDLEFRLRQERTVKFLLDKAKRV